MLLRAISHMNFTQFKDGLKDFTMFSFSDIRLIDPRLYRRRLVEWQEKGYIKNKEFWRARGEN